MTCTTAPALGCGPLHFGMPAVVLTTLAGRGGGFLGLLGLLALRLGIRLALLAVAFLRFGFATLALAHLTVTLLVALLL